MLTVAEARRIALSLPEAIEQDHHGFPSFRVGGRIFATLPDGAHLNVFLDDLEVAMAVGSAPTACEELWWGRRLRGVRVDLRGAGADLVGDLLADAWQRKAPRRLVGTAPPRPESGEG